MPAGNAEAAEARDSQVQGLNYTVKCVLVVWYKMFYLLGHPVPNSLTSLLLSAITRNQVHI